MSAEDDEHKCPPCRQKVAAWMTSYSDLVTLILCFFVLLFALSTIDARKFDLAASSFQRAFNGVLTSMPTVAVQPEVLTPRLGGDAQNKRIAADAARQIKQVVANQNMEEAVKVDVTDTGIAIRISGEVSFASGSDRLTPEFIRILEDVMEIVNRTPGREIRVEGHTDNIPIRTARFASNWELSAFRALAVVRFLYERGADPAKMSAVGYGEFRPIAPNDTEANRRQNRRIDVYIEYLERAGN